MKLIIVFTVSFLCIECFAQNPYKDAHLYEPFPKPSIYSANSVSGSNTHNPNINQLFLSNNSTDEQKYRLQGYLSEWYDRGTEKWISSGKFMYFYDAKQQLIQASSNNNNSTEKKKSEYSYTQNGKKALQIDYEWSNYSMDTDWKAISKDRYFYDSKDRETLYVYDRFSRENNSWNTGQYKYSYDTLNRMTAKIHCLGIDKTPYQKIEHSYNTQNNILSSIHYKWDYTSATWQNYLKYEYTYNDQDKYTVI